VRNLIILIFIMIALAMIRWLVKDVIGAVKKALNSSSDGNARQSTSQTRTGHMVRDPVSGTYLDETLALREIINGKIFYFESKENRDAYLRQGHSG
jgi:YHS domain-containing protein